MVFSVKYSQLLTINWWEIDYDNIWLDGHYLWISSYETIKSILSMIIMPLSLRSLGDLVFKLATRSRSFCVIFTFYVHCLFADKSHNVKFPPALQNRKHELPVVFPKTNPEYRTLSETKFLFFLKIPTCNSPLMGFKLCTLSSRERRIMNYCHFKEF